MTTPVMECGPCNRGRHDRCRLRGCECPCGGYTDLAPTRSGQLLADATSAARASAWGLWGLSLVAMGTVFAAIDAQAWGQAATLTLVMLLLAWAAGHERDEQRACEEQQLDVWLGAWA